jgi:hypothetical protein
MLARRIDPAFITGTSSEYLGLRPLRRLLRERPVVFVAGPRGSGRSAVGLRVASEGGLPVLVLGTAELHDEVVACVRAGCWSERLVEAPALVLDGPTFLQSRTAALRAIRDLLRLRRTAERRTVVVEVQQDRSLCLLMEGMPAGSMVTVALRWPASRAGRLRFARRACDELSLPRSAAAGTEALEPWSYPSVLAELGRRKGEPAPLAADG